MNRFRPGRFRPGLVLALVALAFSCSFAPDTARADAGTLPLGIHWRTVPWAPCGTTDVAIRFSLCECQVDLLGAELLPGGGIALRLRAEPNVVCVTCTPDSVTVSLGARAPGWHRQLVRFDVQYVRAPADSGWVEPGHEEYIEFAVQPTCPPSGGIPYLDEVFVAGPQLCPTCPPRVCPGDSIDVHLIGTFPDDCTWLRGIDVVPSMIMSPLPGPPTIRINYEQNSCLDRACIAVPQPWRALVRLPALPSREDLPYILPVEGWLSDVCSDSLPEFLGRTSALFTVAASCSTGPYTCFNVRWGPDPTLLDLRPGIPPGCDAVYTDTKPATLTFNVGAVERRIAGIQGRLLLDDAASGALSIGAIVPLIPGWQVARTAEPGGVRFIAFAGPGAEPVPASRAGTPYPVFTVEVNPTGAELPERARLSAIDLIVSDDFGTGIPGCPQITLTIGDGPNVARLCQAPSACDANGDGQADVRDLVKLLLCLNPPPNVRLDCPDSSVVDCDRDSDFDLSDVFCCARVMLGGTPGGEGDSLRDAPEIALRFGVPRALEGGVLEVPLSLEGMAGVVAGRFNLTYPDERYTVDGISFEGAPSSWWTMHEVAAGRIGVALLDLSGMDGLAVGTMTNVAQGAAMTIRLRLRDGAAGGGELSVAAHDFAAADGIALATPNASPRVELGSVGRVALSAARPNPFGGTTSLALTLPLDGPAEVAVFDAAGRRVSTLLRETNAAAGTYMLAWNGADDSGGKVAGGVYFVRVVSGTGSLSRKLLYLPGGMR